MAVVRGLVLCCYCSFVASGWAASKQVEANRFELRPHICIGEPQQACQVGIEFIWQLSAAQPICIEQAGQPLFCSELQQGHHFEAMALEQATVYTLYSLEQRFEPLRRQLKVLYVGQDVRLRRKHPWSLF